MELFEMQQSLYNIGQQIKKIDEKIVEKASSPATEGIGEEIENLQAKDVFDCAKNNDKIAIEQCNIACKYLGKALALIACVVNPEVFVIGGGMARAGQIIINTTQKYFKEQAFHACRETKFKQATLGNNAGIYGSAYMIIS